MTSQLTDDSRDNGGGLSRDELLTLAHELRGALTVIGGYAELMRRSLDEPSRLAASEGIERAVRRADRLIASALMTDDALGEVHMLDLAELAERVADEQRAATGRAIEVHPHEHPTVRGDADSLSRLLGNLIDNAAKYSAASASVEIEVGGSGETATVAVLDRGPGIKESNRATAFNLFERLDADEDVAGTGVGLAVVRAIADAHEGVVAIDARPGGGSIVTLHLPRV